MDSSTTDKITINQDKLNDYEQEFIKIYGTEYFNELIQFIKDNDITGHYNKSRNNPLELLKFGFHYGIITIVAFCYCKLKLSIDIHEIVNGYFKTVNSTTPEFVEHTSDGRSIARAGVPVVHNPGANDGITFATIDKYTPNRQKCMNYLLRMIRFSKVQTKKDHKSKQHKYIYTIVDKYINDYHLLDVL